MELLNRYLHAVKFWLPKSQQDDIIAELSEDIRSQIQDKEAEIGRKLNEAELAAILKHIGRPVIVATRYLPQRQLIGPVLFPIYLFVLKIVMLCYLVPWILVWIGLMTFSPVYRAGHSGGALLGVLGSFWSSFWLTAFISIGVVTLIFAVIERSQMNPGFLEDWDPRKLPVVRDPKLIHRADSTAELVIGILFTMWWVNVLGFRNEFEVSGARITLAPVWRYFVCGFLSVSVANIAVSAANLFRPYWTPLRACLRLATDFMGSALFCWLLKSSILAEIVVPNVPPGKTLEITNAINLWTSRTLPVFMIAGVIIVLLDVRRIFRVKTTSARLAQGEHYLGTRG